MGASFIPTWSLPKQEITAYQIKTNGIIRVQRDDCIILPDTGNEWGYEPKGFGNLTFGEATRWQPQYL